MPTNKNKPLVSCLILNWNRLHETNRCIDSVLGQTYQNIEIILVDNNSDDGSKEFFKDSKKIDKFLVLDKNYGCPGGRNRGVKLCKGEYVFYVDNDGLLHESAVDNAVSFLINNPKTAILTGEVFDFIDIQEVNTKIELPDPLFQNTVLFQGGVSIHRKHIYDLVGLYPDDYMYGGEESYLSLRVLDQGLQIQKSNQVILFHKKSLFARNIKKESISLWMNNFYNAYQTYPLVFFLLYFFIFIWLIRITL